MAKYRKCSRTTLCQAMLSRADYGSRRGLRLITVLNLKTHKERFGGICHHLNAQDKGLMVNFCPWCGGDVQVWKNRGEK